MASRERRGGRPGRRAPADVATRELAKGDAGRLATGTSGAFNVPSFRNVELTGPYMHNGGMATLEEVLEFYNRGGNFASQRRDAEYRTA
jgi:cytochrome c peroxidase